MNLRKLAFVLLLLFLCGMMNSCSSVMHDQRSEIAQQLRIENRGDADLIHLTVVFPGKTPTETIRIFFGDVLAGTMSEYKDIPSGVYRYAAYEYTLAGTTVNQFVVDWLGEKPLAGETFTYRLRLQLEAVQGNQVQLEEVVVDVP